MNLKSMIDYVRRRLDDKAVPPLWSKEELTDYINDAQAEAAERARLIYDETSPLATLQIKAGQAKYELPGIILGVDRIKIQPDGPALRRRTRNWLDQNCPRWESSEGAPTSFVEREGYLLLTPTPVEDATALMSHWRLPRELLKCDTDEPEIPERHHIRMLDWVISLAYSKRDADTYDERKAESYEFKFERSFGFRQDANVQRKHRLHSPVVVTPTF